MSDNKMVFGQCKYHKLNFWLINIKIGLLTKYGVIWLLSNNQVNQFFT